MPTNKEIIERAKSRGIDMSWLGSTQESPTPQIQGPFSPAKQEKAMPQINPPQQQFNPVAQQMLDAIGQHQKSKPVTTPFAPGTPTQARRQADTQAQQWQDQFGHQRELDRIAQEQWERQFEADQAYRNAQLALQRGSAARAAPGEIQIGPQEAYQSLQALVDDAIQRGGGWDHIYNTMLPNRYAFEDAGIKFDDAVQQAYELYLQGGQQRIDSPMPYFRPDPQNPLANKWAFSQEAADRMRLQQALQDAQQRMAPDDQENDALLQLLLGNQR